MVQRGATTIAKTNAIARMMLTIVTIRGGTVSSVSQGLSMAAGETQTTLMTTWVEAALMTTAQVEESGVADQAVRTAVSRTRSTLMTWQTA